jgi:hypothetical protein
LKLHVMLYCRTVAFEYAPCNAMVLSAGTATLRHMSMLVNCVGVCLPIHTTERLQAAHQALFFRVIR